MQAARCKPRCAAHRPNRTGSDKVELNNRRRGRKLQTTVSVRNAEGTDRTNWDSQQALANGTVRSQSRLGESIRPCLFRRKNDEPRLLNTIWSSIVAYATKIDNAAYLKIIPARGVGVAAGGVAGEIEKVSQVFQPAGRFWLSNSK